MVDCQVVAVQGNEKGLMLMMKRNRQGYTLARIFNGKEMNYHRKVILIKFLDTSRFLVEQIVLLNTRANFEI